MHLQGQPRRLLLFLQSVVCSAISLPRYLFPPRNLDPWWSEMRRGCEDHRGRVQRPSSRRPEQTGPQGQAEARGPEGNYLAALTGLFKHKHNAQRDLYDEQSVALIDMSGLQPDEEEAASQFDVLSHLSAQQYSAREKKLLRKIDFRLMPMLFVIIVLKWISPPPIPRPCRLLTVSFSYLDRNALANARVLDIDQGLELSGADFNTAVSVFFIGYITLQIPSNLILTRVRPSIYLASV